MEMDWLKAVAAIALGAGLYAGATGDIPIGEYTDGTPSTDLSSSNSEYQTVPVRQIVNNPVEYEGETVRIEGGSNSLKDFIKSGGYTLDMDCSNYPSFDYVHPSGIVVKGVIELENPGESGPRVRCLEPPKAQK